MKKLLVALSLLFLLTGCAKEGDDILSNQFEVVEANERIYTLKDKNTGVYYYYICNGGRITPVYNSDGTIKVED